MPTAECRCKKCEKVFAHLTFQGEDTPPVCPRCKGKDILVETKRPGFMNATGLGSLLTHVPKGPP